MEKIIDMPLGFDLSKYKTDEFIETGTLHGAGCIKAVRAGFKRIQSIEILESNFFLSKKRLSKHLRGATAVPEIELHFGDSSEILPKILKSIDWRCTFWLDGHGGYKGTGVGKKNCPLMEELDAIADHHIRDHIILIDDMRIIRKTACNTKGVTENSVLEKLVEINPLYNITYVDNNLKWGLFENDCLVASC